MVRTVALGFRLCAVSRSTGEEGACNSKKARASWSVFDQVFFFQKCFRFYVLKDLWHF